MSKFILDTRLSNDHYVLCTEAIRRDIIDPDDLNEGRRTLAEQREFWENQPPLAAFPNPNAPHIKQGRQNHDLDVNSFNGAARRLANFYEEQGVNVSFCVGGETWHICIHSETELARAADKIRRQRDNAVLKQGEREKAVKFLKHQLHYIKDPDTGRRYFRHGKPRPDEGYDTFFNEELETAVKKFQRDFHLTADGEVGPETDKKIDAIYAHQKRRRKSARERAQERKAKVQRGEQL
jgi:hypothetical protein